MIEIFHAFVDAAMSEGREFVLIGGHAVNAHGYDRTTIDFEFKVDTTTQEFLEILNRYATESIRERLLSDLKGLV